MKKIIILVVILALGGGGYVGYTKFVAKPETVEEPEPEIVEEPEKVKVPVKMPLKPLSISLYNNGEVTHLYGLNMALDLYDESILEKAEALRPKLRHVVMKYLLKLEKSAPRLLQDEAFIRQKLFALTEPVLTKALKTEEPAVTGIYIHSLGAMKSVR